MQQCSEGRLQEPPGRARGGSPRQARREPPDRTHAKSLQRACNDAPEDSTCEHLQRQRAGGPGAMRSLPTDPP
eukprot:15165922-Alexandrium_andersonii.AAC.1